MFIVHHLTLGGHGKNAIGTFHTNCWNYTSTRPVNQRFIKDFVKKHGPETRAHVSIAGSDRRRIGRHRLVGKDENSKLTASLARRTPHAS